MAKKIAYYGIYLALTFMLSWLEWMLPLNIGPPGVKLGLANAVVLIVLWREGAGGAFLVSAARILLTGLLFGSPVTLLYSAAGGLLSYGVMVLLHKSSRIGIVGVSLTGGVCHNLGQILAACMLLGSFAPVFYLPVLILTGTLFGALVGLAAHGVLKALERAGV